MWSFHITESLCQVLPADSANAGRFRVPVKQDCTECNQLLWLPQTMDSSFTTMSLLPTTEHYLPLTFIFFLQLGTKKNWIWTSCGSMMKTELFVYRLSRYNCTTCVLFGLFKLNLMPVYDFRASADATYGGRSVPVCVCVCLWARVCACVSGWGGRGAWKVWSTKPQQSYSHTPSQNPALV